MGTMLGFLATALERSFINPQSTLQYKELYYIVDNYERGN